MPITVHSDATAAIGIARRNRLGKIRHLDVTDLWMQDKIRSKQISLLKVLGADNVAEDCIIATVCISSKVCIGYKTRLSMEQHTTYVGRSTIETALKI